MCGTLAKVSALLITVGPPQRPTTAGNGGRIRGMPRLPSSDSISADSSPTSYAPAPPCQYRSEERRVGKECRSRWAADHYEKRKNIVAMRSHIRELCTKSS